MEKRDAALSLRVPQSLKDALSEFAKADDRKLNDYVTLALQAHVDRMKKEKR